MPDWDWANIKEWIQAQAPASVAAGDVSSIKKDFELAKEMDLSGIDHAVSMAFPLPRQSLAGIKERPTLLYKHVYSQLNYLMDRTALGVALLLQEMGARAVAIPASQLIEWEELLAHVDHRQVAVHLGQGWYGRNNILVTPARGAQVRLVTVLTDMEIDDPGPWAGHNREMGCGKCVRCVTACPVGAIHTSPEDFDKTACAARNKEHDKFRGIGQRICGVCVRACHGPAGIRDE